jgi:polyvinyl alcohol dehydrogenase (cytochrome)
MQAGRKIWQTYMVPDNNGNLGGYSGGGVWSSTPVIDLKRHAIYVGTGNNLSVPKSIRATRITGFVRTPLTTPTPWLRSI